MGERLRPYEKEPMMLLAAASMLIDTKLRQGLGKRAEAVGAGALLEDGSTAYMQSYLLEPCRRKGELLRMIRQGDAVAVYAGDDLTGVVGCLPTGGVEELRTYLKVII